MKYLEKNKGITLIALIITIVVLLILAGVTISQITGSENAMEKATQAREKDKQGTELDAIKLAVVNSVASGLDGFVDTTTLKTGLTGLIQENPEDVIVGDSPWTVTSPSGRVYEINKNSTVNEVTGLILTPKNITLTIEGNTYEEKIITAKLIDIDGTISWSNSTDIIDVIPSADNKSATIKAKTGGTEIITVNCSNGDYATCTVTVEDFKPLAKDVLVLTNNFSPYVDYMDANGNTIHCRVLYNDVEEDNTHGLQIISSNIVESLMLGKESEIGYNNAIEELNNKAENYNNTSLSYDARCIGSVATASNESFIAKDDEAEMQSNGYKGTDTHYEEDYNKMESLNIKNTSVNTNNEYWLASRHIFVNEKRIRYIRSDGICDSDYLIDDRGRGYSATKGFRPVFLIKSNVKVKSGDGLTKNTAFVLEAVE